MYTNYGLSLHLTTTDKVTTNAIESVLLQEDWTLEHIEIWEDQKIQTDQKTIIDMYGVSAKESFNPQEYLAKLYIKINEAHGSKVTAEMTLHYIDDAPTQTFSFK